MEDGALLWVINFDASKMCCQYKSSYSFFPCLFLFHFFPTDIGHFAIFLFYLFEQLFTWIAKVLFINSFVIICLNSMLKLDFPLNFYVEILQLNMSFHKFILFKKILFSLKVAVSKVNSSNCSSKWLLGNHLWSFKFLLPYVCNPFGTFYFKFLLSKNE